MKLSIASSLQVNELNGRIRFLAKNLELSSLFLSWQASFGHLSGTFTRLLELRNHPFAIAVVLDSVINTANSNFSKTTVTLSPLQIRAPHRNQPNLRLENINSYQVNEVWLLNSIFKNSPDEACRFSRLTSILNLNSDPENSRKTNAVPPFNLDFWISWRGDFFQKKSNGQPRLRGITFRLMKCTSARPPLDSQQSLHYSSRLSANTGVMNAVKLLPFLNSASPYNPRVDEGSELSSNSGDPFPSAAHERIQKSNTQNSLNLKWELQVLDKQRKQI